jgi:NADH-quinone oxidoreductase subunit C
MSETEAPAEAEAEEQAPTELHGAPLTTSRGQDVVHPSRDGYLELIEALRADGFDMCVDVTAVDYLVDPARDLPPSVTPERFEVVVNLLSLEQHRRLRVRVQVPANDPVVASLFRVHPGTEAMEREVFDMFGIRFDGHPDLTRILMPEEWEGHPLRKDYPIGRVPVQFKHPPATR